MLGCETSSLPVDRLSTASLPWLPEGASNEDGQKGLLCDAGAVANGSNVSGDAERRMPEEVLVVDSKVPLPRPESPV